MQPDSFSLAVAVRRQQRKAAALQQLEQGLDAEAARIRKPRKRVSKAQALVDFGLADNLADARAQLRDMGE